MKIILAILFLTPFLGLAQKDPVLSGVYYWNEPTPGETNKVYSTVLLEGKVHDFAWMQLTANSLNPSLQRIQQTVSKKQEQLIIVKTGVLQVGIGDSTFSLNAGSVAVLMPGEKILLNSPQPCSFYIMKYKSKARKDMARGEKNGGSFVKFWNEVPFKPNNKGGGRMDFFEHPTAMLSRLELHVTVLKEGLRSHDPHTHRAKEIILMIEGDTEMQIGEQFFKGKTGDFFYMTTNVLHGIKNIGTKPCMYFAMQFE